MNPGNIKSGLTVASAKSRLRGTYHQTSKPKDTLVDDAKDRWVLALSDVEAQGRRDYFSLRKHWSCAMIAWITVLVVFNIALTVAVGIGCLVFEQEWFVTAVTIETFLQIVAMGVVAVNYLFSDYSPSNASN